MTQDKHGNELLVGDLVEVDGDEPGSDYWMVESISDDGHNVTVQDREGCTLGTENFHCRRTSY